MSEEKTEILERTEQEIKEIPSSWKGDSRSSKEGQEWDKSKEMDFTYTNLDKFISISAPRFDFLHQSRASIFQ